MGQSAMQSKEAQIEVYLEVGRKRTFAGALDWPGWLRSGRDEEAALAALSACAPRYAGVLTGTSVAFTPPDGPAGLLVVERLAGNSTTDFGAPGLAPTRDAAPLDEAERARSEVILTAIWRAFDGALLATDGKALRTGPRGGGRDRDEIARHVLGADASYLRLVAQQFSEDETAPLDEELERTRAAIRAALVAGARGEIPREGPRGGTLWTSRYYVRRVAWHTLDHAWEIEDRTV
jgi:hypothetical protein